MTTDVCKQSIIIRIRMVKNGGFTLIELLIVVAIVGIIASIAAPNLLRARWAGNEASAIGSLRAINAAQAIFATSCSNGSYAPSLLTLGRGPAGGSDGFIGADLGTDPALKSSYTITLTPGTLAVGSRATCNGLAPGSTATTYFVSAEPTSAGGRFFATNQDGTIYQSTSLIPVAQHGAPVDADPIG